MRGFARARNQRNDLKGRFWKFVKEWKIHVCMKVSSKYTCMEYLISKQHTEYPQKFHNLHDLPTQFNSLSNTHSPERLLSSFLNKPCVCLIFGLAIILAKLIN